MERGSRNSIEERHEALKLRLVKVAESVKRNRREIIKVDFGAVPLDLNLVKFYPEELLVTVAERIFQSKTSVSEQVAKKLLIKASQAADILADSPSGNDVLGKFMSESMNYLSDANPQMATDVQRILDAAEKRSEERAVRREVLHGKWQAALERRRQTQVY